MAHSLEARSPFCDHELMELAAGLPAPMKHDGARAKRIFREAMRPWLPASVMDRPKKGFSVPVGEWLTSGHPELLSEILLDPVALRRGLFREERVRALVSRFDGSRPQADKLWALLVLELWFRSCVERDPSAGPLVLHLS